MKTINLVFLLYDLYAATFPNFLSPDACLIRARNSISSCLGEYVVIQRNDCTSSKGMPLTKRSSKVTNTGPNTTSHSAPSSTGVEARKTPHQSKI